MVVVARSGEIVLVNEQAEKLFGYPREELLGRQIETLMPERFRPEQPERHARFFAVHRMRDLRRLCQSASLGYDLASSS